MICLSCGLAFEWVEERSSLLRVRDRRAVFAAARGTLPAYLPMLWTELFGIIWLRRDARSLCPREPGLCMGFQGKDQPELRPVFCPLGRSQVLVKDLTETGCVLVLASLAAPLGTFQYIRSKRAISEQQSRWPAGCQGANPRISERHKWNQITFTSPALPVSQGPHSPGGMAWSKQSSISPFAASP